MSSLLQEVTRSGTAAKAQALLKRPDLYGKTGTTNDSLDAWFAGYQPNLVAVVWVGYDQPRKLGSRETGGGLGAANLDRLHAVRPAQHRGGRDRAPRGSRVCRRGEWTFDEYSGNRGVSALTAEDDKAPPPASADEKKSVLDLFKN